MGWPSETKAGLVLRQLLNDRSRSLPPEPREHVNDVHLVIGVTVRRCVLRPLSLPRDPTHHSCVGFDEPSPLDFIPRKRDATR